MIKLPKGGSVGKVKWQYEPGFGMLNTYTMYT